MKCELVSNLVRLAIRKFYDAHNILEYPDEEIRNVIFYNQAYDVYMDEYFDENFGKKMKEYIEETCIKEYSIPVCILYVSK